jgi:Trk-type K+ transport system membrane component
VGTLLLFIPISHKSGTSISFTNALFIAASSYSTTGLTTVDILATFNFLGQLVILLLVQVGGIGFMSIWIGIFILLGKRINIKNRILATNERGSGKIGGTIKMYKYLLIIIFSLEIVFSIIIALNNIKYLNTSLFDNDVLKLIWSSIFLSITSINNAGMDIYGSLSLGFFSRDYFLLSVVMLEMVIGGVGFPIIYEICEFFVHHFKKQPFRFSLFFKMAFNVYFFVLIGGIAMTFVAELSNVNGIFSNPNISVTEGIFNIIFINISARSCGFFLTPVINYTPTTRIIITMLMWIGASPSSTGGGIRTTTFFIVLLSVIMVIKNKDHIEIRQRIIPKTTQQRAMVVAITSIILIAIATFLIQIQTNFSLELILFEVVSAFGTTGFSLGTSVLLPWIPKTILIIVMFIGQLGITSTLLAFNNNPALKQNSRLIEEDVVIS